MIIGIIGDSGKIFKICLLGLIIFILLKIGLSMVW